MSANHLVTAQEAARMLGVSQTKLHEYRKIGTLRVSPKKIGGHWAFYRDEVEDLANFRKNINAAGLNGEVGKPLDTVVNTGDVTVVDGVMLTTFGSVNAANQFHVRRACKDFARGLANLFVLTHTTAEKEATVITPHMKNGVEFPTDETPAVSEAPAAPTSALPPSLIPADANGVEYCTLLNGARFWSFTKLAQQLGIQTSQVTQAVQTLKLHPTDLGAVKLIDEESAARIVDHLTRVRETAAKKAEPPPKSTEELLLEETRGLASAQRKTNDLLKQHLRVLEKIATSLGTIGTGK